MNKIKFLSCAVMAAFFALGITSCEKENFTPEVDIEAPDINIPDIDVPEGYKPGDAVVSITPQVVAVINGVTKTVTNEATITYNGKEELEYTVVDKGIAAMTVNVVASYDYEVNGETETFTAEYPIKVPALSAGQVAVFTPTLVITINFEAEEEDNKGESRGFVAKAIEGSTVIEKKTGEIEFDNASNYYYTNVTGEVTTGEKYGTFISNIKVADAYKDNTEIEGILGSYNQGLKDYKITVKGFNLWPNTKTCFIVEQIAETKNYEIKEQFETRAITEVVAATFTVTDYSYVIGTTPEYYNAGAGHNGHGHAHSHGHGHGHGNGNAGGGIVWGI